MATDSPSFSDAFEDMCVDNATVVSLLRFLNRQIPWVWILGHQPNPTIEWWNAQVPLSKAGTSFEGEVRFVAYDVQMPTDLFINRSSDFEDFGITLVQSRQRMPNTLELDRIPEGQRAHVLRLNGAFLYIELPHADETALVRCFERGYLAGVPSA